MYIYTRMLLFRLIWIITLLFYLSGCSSVGLTSPNKNPVAASIREKQLLEVGEQHFKQGKYQAALQKVEQAYQLNPDNAEALYAIALCYLSLEQYNKSLEFSRRAATYQSEDLADTYLLMGAAYQRLDDPWNALRSYRFAADKYPENSKIQYRLGETYVYLGKPEFATDAFKAAIAVAPDDAASHFQLATLYYENNYITPALLSFSVSLLLKPDQARAPLIQQNIFNLLGSQLESRNTDEGNFQSVDAALIRKRASLLNNTEKYSAFDVIKAQYLVLYKELDTAKIKNQKNTFVMDNYVTFYNKLHQQGLDETSVYYIFQNSRDKVISNWLQKNAGKVKKLEQFIKDSN